MRWNFLQSRNFDQEILESPVERLVTLRGRVPAHSNGRNVRTASWQQRGEIKLHTLVGVLVILEPPSRHGIERRQSEKALGIFQVLVATEELLPLSAVLFGNDGAGEEDPRGHARRGFWQAVDGQHLLLAGLSQIAVDEHFRIGTEQSFRCRGNPRRDSRRLRGSRRVRRFGRNGLAARAWPHRAENNQGRNTNTHSLSARFRAMSKSSPLAGFVQ